MTVVKIKFSGVNQAFYFLTFEVIFQREWSIFCPDTEAEFVSPLVSPTQKKSPIFIGDFDFLLRSRADSNRCRSFCRAQPSHSATGPL